MYVRYTCGFPYAKVSIYANNLTFSHHFTLKNCQQLSNRKIISFAGYVLEAKLTDFVSNRKYFLKLNIKKSVN